MGAQMPIDELKGLVEVRRAMAGVALAVEALEPRYRVLLLNSLLREALLNVGEVEARRQERQR